MEDQVRQDCADCGCTSEPVKSHYTLIGKHGWRSVVSTDGEGRRHAQFYCPRCWMKRKDTLRPRPSPSQPP
jgi:hypothetical protein